LSDDLSILPATHADLPIIHRFIHALAEYEKLAHHCHATIESLDRTLFGPRPYAEVLIARLGDMPVGYALFFHNYSTFLASPGIYLEDVFVLPEHRNKGIGKAVLKRLAQPALERGCSRLEWSVLDWNTPSIEFYKRIGATVHPDWRICRMTANEMTQLAKG
jgi:GNAT superfamily N-acetyltransferase